MDNNKTRYYDTLGIDPTSNREQIAEAFRNKALRSHPMRNPREKEAQAYKQFVKVCEAYEVLSDPLMKRIYDKYGEYSLKNGVMKGMDRFQGYVNKGQHYKVFESFFGSTNPYIQEPAAEARDQTELQQIDAEHREGDIHAELHCDLFEFYNGAVKEVNVARKTMLSETQGSVINADKFNVTVLPGFSEQTRLVFPGRGHESFAARASDMIISFKQKPINNYKRSGDDLIYTQTVTLMEALQMRPVAVPTLDNRTVYVAPTEVVSPQTELRVPGEGMPRQMTGDIVVDTTTQQMPHDSQPRGDLIVRFNIVFPRKIMEASKQEIIAALAAN